MFWFWVLAVPAVILAFLSLLGEKDRWRFYLQSLLSVSRPADLLPVTVIVPVKGPEEGLRENLASLASQDYPDFELIVTARTAADIPHGVAPKSARVILAGDADYQSSEKIQNLLAAVAAARPESAVLAFADSDGRASRTWLRALVVPLAGARAGASTGYRWHLPEPADFWSLLRSVWNAVIAGRLGPGPNDFVWGGAMALRKDLFYRCRVPESWTGSVSDDYSLSAAVRRAGLEIHFAPGAMTATVDHTSAGEFLSWIRRQMTITRVYYPRLWWAALIAHGIYCGATVACLLAIATGHPSAAGALVLIWGIGMRKGANRAKLARMAMPGYETWFRRHGWTHAWLTPLATWFWMYSLAVSAFTNVIEWRGRRYRLSRRASKGPQEDRERQHSTT